MIKLLNRDIMKHMRKSKIDYLKGIIRTINDFPKEGVAFKDISPLLANGEAIKTASKCLSEAFLHESITMVMAIEARGFIFGSILAVEKKASFIMIRKAGKLPPVGSNVYFNSQSEYSSEKLGFDSSLMPKGKILIHDDVLATGGTVKSVVEALTSQCGIDPLDIYLSFLVELSFLKGKENILKDSLIPESHFRALLVY